MSGTSFVAMWEGTPTSVEDGRGESFSGAFKTAVLSIRRS